ncbi:MAG TPA: lactate racemase domain-containing protein [Negativicutes bacterium]|nr:lactate racemase domain-containing protein [Negativicutes bacterium]
MTMVQKLLSPIPLPRIVKIQQRFITSEIMDISAELRKEMAKPGVGERIKPGMSIALTVGSRGTAELPLVTRTIVEEIKQRGGLPFVVPSMGSHGGATAEGQQTVLANLGVTEETAGCPIRSSMEVVEVGRLDDGLAVLIDKYAYEADGIVVMNRVKPHPSFDGPCESGLAKMLSIGLGKQKGADSCHEYGYQCLAEHVLRMAEMKIARSNVLFGIGTIENAYDKIARIVMMPSEELIETEKKMLIEAKGSMPRIFFDQMDVLVVSRIGKDISGGGMDPNITGRYYSSYKSGGPSVNKLVVLDLTEGTHGNANGMGAADFTTRKLFNKIDYDAIYTNALTATLTAQVRIPMILETDKEAIKSAIKTCNSRDMSRARVVIIKDTLHLSELYISESMIDEAQKNPDITIIGEPTAMQFDAYDNIKINAF